MEQNKKVSNVLFNPNLWKAPWCSEGGKEWFWPRLSLSKWQPVEPWPLNARGVLLPWQHRSRGASWVQTHLQHSQAVELGKPTAPSRAQFPHLWKGETLLIVLPPRTVITVKWEVCDTIKQQKNIRKSIIRNNLLGNTFLNVFNTLLQWGRGIAKLKKEHPKVPELNWDADKELDNSGHVSKWLNS